MIEQIFAKHYKRIEEDLKQIQGFTPVMQKIISIDIKKLEEDILKYFEKVGKADENSKETI